MGDGVTQALNYRRRQSVLAVRSQWILLTGDAELRRLANAERDHAISPDHGVDLIDQSRPVSNRPGR